MHCQRNATARRDRGRHRERTMNVRNHECRWRRVIEMAINSGDRLDIAQTIIAATQGVIVNNPEHSVQDDVSHTSVQH